MPSSTRIKGKGLTLKVGTTDYTCDFTSIVLDNEEADDDKVTFCDVGAGGNRQYYIEVEAVQSLAAESLWRFLWENTGTEVTFTFSPHGNTTATADQPLITGTAVVGPRPRLGGDATAKGETFTFEHRFDLVGEPVLDDGA